VTDASVVFPFYMLHAAVIILMHMRRAVDITEAASPERFQHA
jgi:hypothetical protein